ncbi:MAG TPA: hypothetical protein VG737_07220 [Cyclobacteriaceae bacterium]|nr:hypothetical protein [Cyclobacteriaceae bacterium]
MKTQFVVLLALAALSCSKKSDDPTLTTGTWAKKSDFPAAGRALSASFDINGKGYVGLGTGDGDINYTDFWEYAPASSAWTQKSAYPGPVPVNASTATTTKGYVVSNSGTLHEFDPGSNQWTTKTPLQDFTNRKSMVAFSLNNLVYFGLGYDGPTLISHPDLWEYNPVTDQWKNLADFPRNILKGSPAFAFAINGKAYVAVSVTGGNTFQDLYQFDPATNSWSQKASMPGNQVVNFWFTNNNKGYIGVVSQSGTGVWEYDPSVNSWREVQSVPTTATAEARAFTVTGKSYVVAGKGTAFTKDVWEFTP